MKKNCSMIMEQAPTNDKAKAALERIEDVLLDLAKRYFKREVDFAQHDVLCAHKSGRRAFGVQRLKCAATDESLAFYKMDFKMGRELCEVLNVPSSTGFSAFASYDTSIRLCDELTFVGIETLMDYAHNDAAGLTRCADNLESLRTFLVLKSM